MFMKLDTADKQEGGSATDREMVNDDFRKLNNYFVLLCYYDRFIPFHGITFPYSFILQLKLIKPSIIILRLNRLTKMGIIYHIFIFYL